MGSESECVDKAPLTRTGQMADRPAQKGCGFDTVRQFAGVWHPPDRKPGVEHGPNVTPNGYSERDNPLRVLTT